VLSEKRPQIRTSRGAGSLANFRRDTRLKMLAFEITFSNALLVMARTAINQRLLNGIVDT